MPLWACTCRSMIRSTRPPSSRAVARWVWSVLPERDQLSVSYTQIQVQDRHGDGRRVAEELVFGKANVTSGAASDIQQVSKIARAMVTQFGFSEETGHVDYANEQQSYLGQLFRAFQLSPETQKKIDEEVRAHC
jgi:cell division protease FtsH